MNTLKDFIKVMKALSDPNRVCIVKMLQHRSMCVCELQAALKIAQPTVSNHLKTLEEAGLVAYRKEGQWVNYYLMGNNPYARELLEKLGLWLQEDSRIEEMVKTVPFLNREEICRK
jgi:ArsR family transcriptional regulator